jgi:predicted metal-dependent peptidase
MRVLEDAVVRLLKTHPFYGHFLLNFHRRKVSDKHPVGVTIQNSTPTLCFDPKVFSTFSSAEQKALLEHVLKHVLHLHMARRKERHCHDWDIACDLAINPTIEDLPIQAALPDKLGLAQGLAAEEYYQILAPLFSTGNTEGQGFGNAAEDVGEYSEEGEKEQKEQKSNHRTLETLDDHTVWQEADSTPLGLAEEVVRGMVQDAYRKSCGEVPGDVRQLVEGMLAPSPVPWRQILRQFVATAGRVGRKSTWKREHRRFAHDTPGIRKRQRLNLLVGVDVSDSTDVRELREAFARELLQIARGRESRITVLYAGSRIQRIDHFQSSSLVAEVYEGGGFTDLRPVFEYAKTMQPRPVAIIYLTDGFGQAPERMDFPTLWVLTKEGQKPVDWGVELRVDV